MNARHAAIIQVVLQYDICNDFWLSISTLTCVITEKSCNNPSLKEHKIK